MKNLYLAITYETHKEDINPHDKRDFNDELTKLFKDLKQQNSIDKNVGVFNYSSKNALIEGLNHSKLCISIEMRNNEINIMKNDYEKENLRRELEEKDQELEEAIEKLESIYKKYKVSIV